LALACECDKRGRLGLEEEPYPPGALLRKLHAAAMAVTAGQAVANGLTGPAIGDWLRKARIEAIRAVRR